MNSQRPIERELEALTRLRPFVDRAPNLCRDSDKVCADLVKLISELKDCGLSPIVPQPLLRAVRRIKGDCLRHASTTGARKAVAS